MNQKILHFGDIKNNIRETTKVFQAKMHNIEKDRNSTINEKTCKRL